MRQPRRPASVMRPGDAPAPGGADGTVTAGTGAAATAGPEAAATAGPEAAATAGPQSAATAGQEAAGTQAAQFGSRTAASAVQWNAFAVAGRQGFQLLSAVVLARVLGPESYGVVGAATIFITLTTLLLDQGLASALIQRPVLSRYAAGATATMNLVSGVVLAGLTWMVAPWVADFYSVDRLTPVLRLLGLGLVVKSLSISPRAMQARRLHFRPIAVADVLGALVGSALGITAALLGAGPEAIVVQVVATDAVIAVLLIRSVRGPVPNLRLSEVRALLPYGSRVMATNGIAYFSRNIDNILVGRVLGIVALSYYGMAYRVLVIPVQMIGQTVSRVVFPAFSRLASRPVELADNLLTASQMLAVVAIPPMVLAAAAAPEIVHVVLGEEWMPAAPLLSVLAVAGARETVVYVTGPLMKATGQVKLAIRYELAATAVQVGGIVIGLQFGLLGVALGYTIAGFVLTPALLAIQRRLAPVTLRGQLAALTAPVHVSLWGALAYTALRTTDLEPLPLLAVGVVGYVAAAGLVAWLAHRATFGVALRRLRGLLRRGGGQPAGAAPAPGPAAASGARS